MTYILILYAWQIYGGWVPVVIHDGYKDLPACERAGEQAHVPLTRYKCIEGPTK